jgi:hypothetical protein
MHKQDHPSQTPTPSGCVALPACLWHLHTLSLATTLHRALRLMNVSIHHTQGSRSWVRHASDGLLRLLPSTLSTWLAAPPPLGTASSFERMIWSSPDLVTYCISVHVRQPWRLCGVYVASTKTPETVLCRPLYEHGLHVPTGCYVCFTQPCAVQLWCLLRDCDCNQAPTTSDSDAGRPYSGSTPSPLVSGRA